MVAAGRERVDTTCQATDRSQYPAARVVGSHSRWGGGGGRGETVATKVTTDSVGWGGDDVEATSSAREMTDWAADGPRRGGRRSERDVGAAIEANMRGFVHQGVCVGRSVLA